MAEFTATVYQNEFLPDGGTDVNAIVTVTCSGAGDGRSDRRRATPARSSSSTPPARWARTKLEAAKVAASAAIDQILDGTYFAVVAGTHQAVPGLPARTRRAPAWSGWTRSARFAAHQAIAQFRSDGGTAMGTWLTLAGRLFDSVPMLAQQHAILLTDGENHNETPEQLTSAIAGVDRQVPVRLPRRRRRLAGRRGAPDRPGPARHGRHHPERRPDEPGLRRADAAVDGPRRRRRPAAGLGAAGRRRSCSSARSPRRSRT